MIGRSPGDSAACDLAAALQATDLAIATAESRTGGQLAAQFARHADLGPYIECGFVVYSVDAKCEVLGIGRSLAERCQAVAPEVNAAIAEGALTRYPRIVCRKQGARVQRPSLHCLTRPTSERQARIRTGTDFEAGVFDSRSWCDNGTSGLASG